MLYKLWDYKSTTYVLLLRVHELTMIVSVLLGCYFLYRVHNCSLIHLNLRIVLCNIPLHFIGMNISRLINYLWEFYLDRNPEFPVHVFTANCFCLFLRFTEEVSHGCIALSIGQIAIERTFATVFRSTYERRGYRLGLLMTVPTYFGSAVFSISVLVYQIFVVRDFKFEERHPTCRFESFPSVLPLYFGIWLAAIVISGSSTATMFVVYHYNRHQHEKKNSVHLPTRYQFQENVRTLRSLLPPITAFLIGNLLGIGCIVYVLLRKQLPEVDLANVLQILEIIPQVYCIFTVSWFAYSFRALRQHVINDVRRLLRKRSRSNRIQSYELTSLGTPVSN